MFLTGIRVAHHALLFAGSTANNEWFHLTTINGSPVMAFELMLQFREYKLVEFANRRRKDTEKWPHTVRYAIMSCETQAYSDSGQLPCL